MTTMVDKILRGKELFLVAGPCSAESEGLCLEIAQELVRLCKHRRVPFIFKASYSKANRLSGDSYRGPGISAGLRFLSTVKERLGVPILTDVHETSEVNEAAEVADILQIPAFLSRQTALALAAAATGRWVNIKKGQYLAPEDMRPILGKVKGDRVSVTERGVSFGYHTLVVDFRSLIIMRQFGAPVIFDATHSLQLPGVSGKTSGGQPEYVIPFCRAAVAVGVDGLFVETSPRPQEARSDSGAMLPLDQMGDLLTQALAVRQSVSPFTLPGASAS